MTKTDFMIDTDLINFIALPLLIFIIGFLYFLPSIVAHHRNHHYKWVISGINLFFGLTGFGYIISLVWAVWPRKTPLFGLMVNDPVTNTERDGATIYNQIGSIIKAVNKASNNSSGVSSRGDISTEIKTDNLSEQLKFIAKQKDEKLISDDEFLKKIQDIISTL